MYQPLAITKDRKFMILINLDSVNIVAKYLERRGQGMVEKVCLFVKHVNPVACLQKQQVQEVGLL